MIFNLSGYNERYLPMTFAILTIVMVMLLDDRINSDDRAWGALLKTSDK